MNHFAASANRPSGVAEADKSKWKMKAMPGLGTEFHKTGLRETIDVGGIE
jgi:hypothetical protein